MTAAGSSSSGFVPYRALVELVPLAREHVDHIMTWVNDREIVGNLAIDGALLEASASGDATQDDGILVMPGSRPYEVDNLIPFFFTAALRMVRRRAMLNERRVRVLRLEGG